MEHWNNGLMGTFDCFSWIIPSFQHSIIPELRLDFEI